MTRARLLRPGALEPRHLKAWQDLQCTHAALDRPFFCPEYVRALDEVRGDIEVAVLEQDGGIAGFFPFQRVSPRVARPPGQRLCDFDGLVAPPDLELDPAVLLGDCDLRAWHFDHLLEAQPSLRRWQAAQVPSPVVDLHDGYESYLAGRRAAGVNWISQVPRKLRKLEREVGPLRFEFDSQDRTVLARVLAWKSAQRERTATDDVLQYPWVLELIDRLLDVRTPGFGCVLSGLYAGPHLVAGHLGMRSRRTLHLWFPAFDLAHEKHSPGLLMFTELIRAAAGAGVERIDLGKGADRYKLSLANAAVPVAEGCVDTRFLHRCFSRAYYAGRARYRVTTLARVLRGPKRRLRRLLRRWTPGE
jgi:CelD/BcsL family acetyltransferase involved in cellulose biosynthesis